MRSVSEILLCDSFILLWFGFAFYLHVIYDARGVMNKSGFWILSLGGALCIALCLHAALRLEMEESNFCMRRKDCLGSVVSAEVKEYEDQVYLRVHVEYEVQGNKYTCIMPLPDKQFSSISEADEYLTIQAGAGVEKTPWLVKIYFDPLEPELASGEHSLHGGLLFFSRFVFGFMVLVMLTILLVLQWHVVKGKIRFVKKS